MLKKTMAFSLGCGLAALLTASALSSAGAQSYGNYGSYPGNNYNNYGRTYDDPYASDRYTAPYTDRNYDSRSNNRNTRDRYGYEPPRVAGQTFTANDQPGQRLMGTQGDDVFHAGHNAVVMTGGPGSDRFVFDAEPWNAGHIADFMPGDDILD